MVAVDQKKLSRLLSDAIGAGMIDYATKSRVLSGRGKSNRLSPYLAARIETLAGDPGDLFACTRSLDYIQHLTVCPWINMDWLIKRLSCADKTIRRRMHGALNEFKGLAAFGWSLFFCRCRGTVAARMDFRALIHRWTRKKFLKQEKKP